MTTELRKLKNKTIVIEDGKPVKSIPNKRTAKDMVQDPDIEVVDFDNPEPTPEPVPEPPKEAEPVKEESKITPPPKICVFCGNPSETSRFVNLQTVNLCQEHYLNKTTGEIVEKLRKP